ncbi:hypothetical protein Q0Z83_027680 [Actinoplanes sichuanensis]|uniref:Uncharacterized protein n=1 Tax=Actinoplanes sichuanensis TaxID=512349 RepID=A0ABW4AW13_9ACTN|nr:hypothetical protein [Actinoplanes sichuanensis]BEL04577.1 hypothetical protein Q0Z83_027680 [Actinoplanes sichuanensis]
MASEPDYLVAIRQADSYPRALRAARLYLGGLFWMVGSALVVALTGLSIWFFLVSAAAIPFIVAGVLGARKTWTSLARELPAMPENELKSASTIATFQDLLRHG